MIVNGISLLQFAPIKNMLVHKVHAHGVSHGLSEAGYDIRIKQAVHFFRGGGGKTVEDKPTFQMHHPFNGRFVIASAMEEFQMPDNLVGIVHDKSTWARRGLSVFNTVIEPGWNGFLTLELVYHGDNELTIPAGAGIAQVVFTHATDSRAYTGRYQNQADAPTPAKSST